MELRHHTSDCWGVVADHFLLLFPPEDGPPPDPFPCTSMLTDFWPLKAAEAAACERREPLDFLGGRLQPGREKQASPNQFLASCMALRGGSASISLW